MTFKALKGICCPESFSPRKWIKILSSDPETIWHKEGIEVTALTPLDALNRDLNEKEDCLDLILLFILTFLFDDLGTMKFYLVGAQRTLVSGLASTLPGKRPRRWRTGSRERGAKFYSSNKAICDSGSLMQEAVIQMLLSPKSTRILSSAPHIWRFSKSRRFQSFIPFTKSHSLLLPSEEAKKRICFICQN